MKTFRYISALTVTAMLAVTVQAKQYTILLKRCPVGQAVLDDSVTDKIVDLKEDFNTFEAGTGTYNNRFMLIQNINAPTLLESVEASDNDGPLRYYDQNGNLVSEGSEPVNSCTYVAKCEGKTEKIVVE